MNLIKSLRGQIEQETKAAFGPLKCENIEATKHISQKGKW